MFNDAAKFRYSDVKSRVSSQNRNQFLDEKEGEKSFGIAVIDIIRNCLEEKQWKLLLNHKITSTT